MGLDCEICARAERIRRGQDPLLIAELGETYTVLGDNQGCPGWCVLLLKEHREHLAELPQERQERIFGEAARVAAAIRAVFPASGKGGGPPRINYECLGNVVPHIHWHIIPRHGGDPEPMKPVWGWPAEQLRGSLSDVQRAALAHRLGEAISR
jgi:diadenosine tetraphosphate (Ap4A) HIT family hydrolase